MMHVKFRDLDFSVSTIFPGPALQSFCNVARPLFFVRAIFRLFFHTPDILIVSLWRACLVGIVIKMLRPRIRLVLFLHFPSDVHVFDYLLTRTTACLSSAVWADSCETSSRRMLAISTNKMRVISFVTQRLDAFPAKPLRPSFVFWGRIHPQKGLSRALHFFDAIRSIRSDSQFFVIGPDGGDLHRIRQLANNMALCDSVHFLGAMDFPHIRQVAERASFYLQTSELEGMAMSVVEAMQLGLVPVVTPVGEITRYARGGENAVVVTDDASAVSDVAALLVNESCYYTLRTNAINFWLHKPLYKDDVLSACWDLLSR